MTKNSLGQEFELTIDRLGINGEGVGYFDGFTIFVEGALPGETILAALYEKRKNFGRARLVKILQAAADRVNPPCPIFGRCGGCQLMHVAYSTQLVAKRLRIVDALARIAKIVDVDVLACEPSPNELNYRNKIQLPCEPAGKTIRLGLYARHSHKLIDVEHCFIHCELGEKVYAHVRQVIKSSGILAYNSQTGEGELRHILIKTAVYMNQVLVTLVTKNENIPGLKNLAEQIMISQPNIKGVVQNINNLSGNVILGNKFKTIAGQSAIYENILGLNFKVSSASFFQVNPAQAQKLYERVVEFACLNSSETILDAYCGVGTLSLILAKRAKLVIGVECVPEAIADAKENALQNNIENTQFFCAKAEDFIQTLKHIDIAILNPPRKGCDESLLARLAILRVGRILYVSCDPATLARDLAILRTYGYVITKVQPFDMFPQTSHVECLVSMVLKL